MDSAVYIRGKLEERTVKIDMARVRAHFAARLIAHHVACAGNGKWKAFIEPLQLSPAFDNYFKWVDQDADMGEYVNFVHACLYKWPKEKIHHFHPFALVNLVARHTAPEQDHIFYILRVYYGFPIYTRRGTELEPDRRYKSSQDHSQG